MQEDSTPVSYTHLDVYKRQAMGYSKKDVAYTAPDCGCTGGAASVSYTHLDVYKRQQETAK